MTINIFIRLSKYQISSDIQNIVVESDSLDENMRRHRPAAHSLHNICGRGHRVPIYSNRLLQLAV